MKIMIWEKVNAHKNFSAAKNYINITSNVLVKRKKSNFRRRANTKLLVVFLMADILLAITIVSWLINF